jgi:BirA family biotin operon repressor/biotin-[acetyl-CoA-carboxylase] ligase
MSARAPIDAAAVRGRLGPRWSAVEVVDEVPSTNAALLSRGADGTDGAVLVAEYQSAGRGRFDRTWTSPPGAGLTFSVRLHPPVATAHWAWLPLLAGVAVAEAVDAVGGGVVDAALKWPNDLLVAAHGQPLAKCGGILVQSDAGAVVIGIGINVSTTAAELPVPEATSLALCGAEIARDDLLVAVLASLDAGYAAWCAAGGDPESSGLAAAYRSRCATLGADVAVYTSAETLRGRAVDVDASGRLVVDVAGQRHAVTAGDVEHLRTDPPATR